MLLLIVIFYFKNLTRALVCSIFFRIEKKIAGNPSIHELIFLIDVKVLLENFHLEKKSLNSLRRISWAMKLYPDQQTLRGSVLSKRWS